MRPSPTTINSLTRRLAVGAAFALLAACGDRRAAADPALSQDLAADLARARGDSGTRDLTRAEAGTGAEPELRDVTLGGAPARARPTRASASPAPAPAPARTGQSTVPTPAPTPTPVATAPAPAPAPVVKAPTPAPVASPASSAPAAAPGLQAGTVATGTVLRLTPHIRVCTNVNSVGDVFEATLASSVTGNDGATIPAGANVVLRVTGLTRAGDDAVLAFEIIAVGVTRQSFSVTATDAGGAVAGSARAPSEIQKGSGRATAQEVMRFGTCVPREGELTVTLTRGVRLSATE